MTRGVDPAVQRRMWARVAEAAARYRRLMTDEAVSYGDPDLQHTAEAMARAGLLAAVERALDVGVDQGELVDAICSADRSFDLAEARAFVEEVPAWRSGIRELHARVLRDLFGEAD